MLLLNYHLIPSILVIIMTVIIIVIVITSIQLSSSWRSYILCFVIFIRAFIAMLHCQIFLGTPFIVSFIIYSMLAVSMVFFYRQAGWKLNYKNKSDITIESSMKTRRYNKINQQIHEQWGFWNKGIVFKYSV